MIRYLSGAGNRPVFYSKFTIIFTIIYKKMYLLMLFCTLKHSVFTDIFVIIQNWKSCCRRIPARGFESPSLRHEVRACQVRRAFCFVKNGMVKGIKSCFCPHFAPTLFRCARKFDCMGFLLKYGNILFILQAFNIDSI